MGEVDRAGGREQRREQLPRARLREKLRNTPFMHSCPLLEGEGTPVRYRTAVIPIL